MEIEVEQGRLAKALGIVSRVAAGARATLPILNNVLLRVDDGKVSLTTTNLDMAIVDYLPAASSKNGAITVPARLLADFMATLPKGVVKITTDGEKVKCQSGKYSSVFNGTIADDFPELPEIEEDKAVKFIMGVDEFKLGMSEILIAVSNDMTRPALTGVYFSTDEENLYLTGTDGYRMAVRRFIQGVKSEVRAIVPRTSLMEVMRSITDDASEVEMLFDESQVRFRIGEIEITSKLIDGSFPDYKTIFPKDNEIEVVVEKAELVRVVKLASLFARETGGIINCEANEERGVVIINSIASEYGENSSEVVAEVVGAGRAALNARYFLDVLNVIEEERVKVEFSGKMSPIIVENEKSKEYQHLIMPLNR